MHGSLFHPEEKYSETLRKVVIWVVDIIAAAVFALLLFIWFGTGVPVQGRSMEPTILTGEQVYLDRIAYRLVSPDRFDCVVFLRGGEYSVRRIAGLPGETVQIADGILYIDGEETTLPGTGDLIQYAGLASEPVVLGFDEYFVLGDNINGSEDSRQALTGNIRESEIVGRVWGHRAGSRIEFLHEKS